MFFEDINKMQIEFLQSEMQKLLLLALAMVSAALLLGKGTAVNKGQHVQDFERTF